ncbi:hypothetical protein KIL84_008767 [Mauremys mutica]|uniref:Uncharacterized protein n=1 Tax=Mauremys mutica TaxID=74926 RepID=A0A9D3X8B2_9SAUR|nr:hypothetical protein KIL84_008767 [Mauremys mutica]
MSFLPFFMENLTEDRELMTYLTYFLVANTKQLSPTYLSSHKWLLTAGLKEETTFRLDKEANSKMEFFQKRERLAMLLLSRFFKACAILAASENQPGSRSIRF